jgi:hypothetical protein
MDSVTMNGTVRIITEKNIVNEKFAKREIIIETDGQYPQHLKIQFVNDKCDLLNLYKIGDVVSIGVNFRGRLFVDKNNVTQCFNSFEGWKIELTGVNHK